MSVVTINDNIYVMAKTADFKVLEMLLILAY